MMKAFRFFYSFLPGSSRCFECSVPFSNPGHLFVKPFGIHPSSFSPHLCNLCEKEARQQEAGAEVELSMLFADVRGSTGLAEGSSTADFKALIQQFYKTASNVLVQHDAMVNRLMGDQVIGLFVPRFAGSQHAHVAIQAARDLLIATGHQDPEGPWIPVGVGVHTGTAYVGAVGTKDGVNEIAILGHEANLTARLSSLAGDGEVLISQTAVDCAGIDDPRLPSRSLEVKGISDRVLVRVLQVQPEQGA
jgi:adenylate cyclase